MFTYPTEAFKLKKIFFPIFAFLASILFYSCAQVVSPSGGQKDVEPPRVLWSSPEMQSTHFKAEIIEIQFDEYIQFRDFKEQFLVSPPLPTAADVEIRSKKIIIEINDSLKKNTTYLFNFGNSIVDINEGNVLENYKYVFSTGNEIDSLSLNGVVADAYSLKTEKGILLMLYDEFYDSIPYLSIPSYTSRSDENGNFSISNIKKGKYKLFALEDKNNNYIFDRADERIAFTKELIDINTKGSDSLKLFLFQEEDQKKYIKEKIIANNSLQLIFSKATDSIYLAPLNKGKLPAHFIIPNKNKDSLSFWWRNLKNELNFQAVVKDGNYIYDSLKIKIPKLENDSLLILKNSLPVVQNYYAPLKLVFQAPVTKINKSKIKVLLNDSLAVNFKLKHKALSQTVEIIPEWKESTKYSLKVLPKAAIDIYGRTNDSLNAVFQTNSPKNFSSLKLNIKTERKKEQKMLQLLDQNGKLLREKMVDSEFIYFKYLQSGNYRIKLIFDANRNKKWDTGNYLNKQSPEKAVLFDGIINLRSNWEKEIIWELK